MKQIRAPATNVDILTEADGMVTGWYRAEERRAENSSRERPYAHTRSVARD